ncbi:MAG: sodium-extruding oxaloacetate decarboxylase subunit alpha [Deltaproteobacteria bacterium]|jgi:oxaloacetate decarboxylase (Na+ extruding) subunit alpha|nr:sodium-extruding oxaloacetate decarboxylase subunit alpha [Deltaproteobacteria bacterium]
MVKKKKIEITELVLRDAHQSLLATRMRTDDMLAIAPKLDKVGYWSVECWGGATFDSCIRFLREDPWDRIRKLKLAMPNTRLQMLLRGQNILGYRHYADDVVDAFVERAAANGVDVFRVFDALNDTRNLERAITAVRSANKHAQGTISYTISPFHTNERFIELGIELEKMGCDSICIKDMAGLITPTAAHDLVSGLKANVKVPLSLHSHATTGMASTALYTAIEAGCDMVDTAISSLSLGTSHTPTETLVAMLRETPHDSELRMDILNEIAEHFRNVRKNYTEFESSFAAADTRILISQIPGGMLSNLESQLKQQNALDKINDVMNEIPNVRKELGYPPLVTPTSQIVGTQAVLNVLQGERYKTITAETKALLGGYYGKTPAPVDKEIQKKAMGDEKPITCRPADLIKPEMHKLKEELKDKAKSIEDVLTYALFPKVALGFFEAREKGEKPPVSVSKPKTKAVSSQTPASGISKYTVTVDGVAYDVAVEEGTGNIGNISQSAKTHASTNGVAKEEGVDVIDAPLAGRVVKFVKQPGDAIESGATVLVIEAMKMETEIKATDAGTLDRYFVTEGAEFGHGQPLYALKK